MWMRMVFLIAALTLSGCSVVNTLRMKSANDELSPIWPQGQTEHEFDAVYIGHKPYVHVTMDGQELLFLIDSGASFTMLFDTPKGRKVSVTKGFELAIAGWGQESKTPAYQAAVASIAFGDVVFNDLKVAYIPLSTTPYYHSEQEAIMDGVIGHDLMRHFAWTFDKKHGRITLNRESVLTSGDQWSVGFDTTFSKLNIPAKLNFNDQVSVERDIVIDTGSRHYLKLNTAFIANEQVTFPATVTAADFGLSGKVEHQRATIDSLSFGEHTFKRVKTNLIPSEDEDDWWVIGSALMNQYVSIIDYHSSQFALVPYSGGSFETQYNLAGLELRKLRNGHLIVRYVSPDFPASDAGIAVGDVIVSLNGIPSTDLTEEDWLAMADTPQSLSLCMLRKTCVSLPLEHIKGYSK